MHPVNVVCSDHRILVSHPYCPKLQGKWKDLKGHYIPDTKQWSIDKEYQDTVESHLRAYFGSQDDQTVTVQLNTDASIYGPSELWFGGYLIASRAKRDDRVRLGPNTICKAGGFRASGGSHASPSVSSPIEGSIIEVRNIPIGIVQKYIDSGACSIVDQAQPNDQATPNDQRDQIMRWYDNLNAVNRANVYGYVQVLLMYQ
jgi:hypothetical protein